MDLMHLIRMDVSRWIAPGSIGNPDDVTLKVAAEKLFRSQSLRAVVLMRLGKWCKVKRIPGAAGFVQRLLLRWYGLEIKVGAPIGGGLYIAHPSGTVISPVSMGENCSIIASVTVGMRNTHDFPTIGDRVFIGAGARVLGGITLGDDCKIGANAVVLSDVAPDATMLGIPAKPVDVG